MTFLRFKASVAAIVGFMSLAAAAQAADPLVWKFEEGQTNRYRMQQTMDMTMKIGGNNVESNVDQTIDMSWTVKDVSDEGVATLEQRIDRMRMTIAAGGQETKIDTASNDEPQGQAAMIKPLLEAMTSEPFIVTMTPRGKITDVEVPEKMVEALKNSPGAAMMGEMMSAEGFKKMISQASLALPENLEPGKTWSQSVEMKIPAIGTQVAETTYTYQGPKEVEGEEYEAFGVSIKLSYKDGAKIEVTNQDSSGEILFNREAGRLAQSNLKQNMDLKITVGNQTMEQQMEQTMEMKWVAEGEGNE